ncbi:MAG: transposase [Bacteroidota bacterium]
MRPKHFTVEDAFYFITTHCSRGSTPFTAKGASETFLKSLKDKQQEIDFGLLAYVLMPNHYHLLLQLPAKISISKLMNHINGASSRMVNAGLPKPLKHLWQGGFHDVVVESARNFAIKINYIHDNPVRWNLVTNAVDYAYSSARFYLDKLGNPYLDPMSFDDFGLLGLTESVHTVI